MEWADLSLDDTTYDPEAGRERKTLGAKLYETALGMEAECFRAEGGSGLFVRFKSGDRHEIASLESESFRARLTRAFHQRERRAPSASALSECALLLAAGAWQEEPKRLNVRVAGYEGRVYIDLCDEARRVVEIDSDGWRVVQSPDDPWFLRSPSMLPLPVPQRGGSLLDLRPFVNCDDDDFTMLSAWMLAALNPSGPYPVLAVSAEQGAGKSTLATVLSLLIDPSSAPRLNMFRTSDDLYAAAGGRWLLAFDNITKIGEEAANDLCRISTGGGLAKRKLYTNNEDVTLTAKRPVILNGISLSVGRLDLLDRTYQIRLWPLKERMLESELYTRFEALRPKLLGALCRGVSAALRQADYIPSEKLPRMADAAAFVLRAERGGGLPWPLGTYAEVMKRHEDRKIEEALGEDHVAQRLMELGQGGGWDGSMRELLSLVLIGAEEGEKRFLPSTAKGLGRRLAELEPALRASGIRIERRRTKTGWWVALAEVARQEEDTGVA